MLISTFESLFKYGLRDFQGLKIEKLWQDVNNYQVVRLDFSGIKNFSSIEEFKAGLTSVLIAGFSLIGFRFIESNIFSASDQLSE